MGMVPRFRRGGVLLVVAGLWLATVLPAAAAGDTLDQSQTVATRSNTMRTPMAQTFQARSSGQLDRVSLMLATAFGAVSATIEIQSVSGGQPSGTVLGSTSFAGTISCCNAWHDFNFNPAVAVAGGTEYAIVVRPTSGYLTWYDSYSADYYPNGQMWLSSANIWFYSATFGNDFCFETWLIPSVGGTPPVLAATSASLNVGEGSTATNTGTYSDADGHTIALTASAGTLSKAGTSNGTWSWSMAAADEAPAQTITITADDGHGLSASTSFTLTIASVPPTVTITGAPATGSEGTAISLTGTVKSLSSVDQTAGFALTWTVTKNGQPFATSTNPNLTVTPDDEGTFVATLTAVDDGGNRAIAGVTIIGANVAPKADLSPATWATLVLAPSQAVTVTGGFTDPGALDSHTGTVNFGDTTPVDVYDYGVGGSGNVIDSHAYAAAGTYTISYTVTDDDGGSSTATQTVTVETPAQALGVIAGYVQTMKSLNGGEKNSLAVKYQAAAAAAARQDTNAACHELDAALNELSAFTSNGLLSAADSAALGSSTWAVHRALACTQVKVGWLTLDL
jgi:hypothetical protein